MGYTGQVAAIHGGMHYTERQEQVELFRKPLAEGGARFLVATDAAGEGINLQFCWIMINFDVPWNPARLEQRMGRIHRYGQKHDPVIILNLVAAKTREGRVLKTLLDKLEKIRKQLKSDKVFDVIGRIFEGVSIRQYMEEALTEEGAAAVARATGGAAHQGAGPSPGRTRKAALRRWRRRVQGTAPPREPTSSGRATPSCSPATFAASSTKRLRCWTSAWKAISTACSASSP